MCSNCLTFKNKSLYRNLDFGQITNTVPCGHCDECNFVKQSDWTTRLSFDIKQCYDLGGVCVFLTFTYCNEKLPYLNFSFDGKEYNIPCFNREHVRIFLRRLKKVFYKKYGSARCNGMPGYRYFFVSEQGSTTNRPHYHCLFFLYPLEKAVFKRKNKFVELSFCPKKEWSDFVELCRSIWFTENNFGFMFPNFDDSKKVYFAYNNKTKCRKNDSPLLGHGIETSSFLNDFSKAAFYVSKYVCKDLCFFSDVVDKYYSLMKDVLSDEDFSIFCNNFPKHWQSNGIGASAVDFLSDDEKLSVINNGLTCPYSNKVVPLPSYCVNRILYNSVRSDSVDGLCNSRYSSKSGKLLYDRLPSSFGLAYFSKIYENRVSRVSKKFAEFLCNFQSNSRFYDSFYSKDFVSALISDLSNVFPDLSQAFCNYHLYLKNCDISNLFECYDFVIFTTDFCKTVFSQSKDVIANSWEFFDQPSVDLSSVVRLDFVDNLSLLHEIFCCYFKNKKKSFYDNAKINYDKKLHTKLVLGLNKYSHF